MNTRTAPRIQFAACALTVSAAGGLTRLIPAGEFTAPRGAMRGGGPWRLTPEGAAAIIADAAARSVEFVVDFEHQTLLAADNGKPNPAAGWIDPQSLTFIADGDAPGLYGAIRWTARAAALVADDEYRYLSPVFGYDPESGAVLTLAHVALTNTPALDEPAAALSARLPSSPPFTPPLEDSMELLKKLLAALGLPETTSETDALAGVAALKTRADAGAAELAVLKAAQPADPDPAKYVPMALYQAERDARLALAATSAAGELAGLIDDAIEKGLALEAARPHLERLGHTDLAALKSLLSVQAPIAALTGMQTGGKPPAGAGGAAGSAGAALDTVDLAVCKALGLSADEFAKGRKAVEAA